MWTKTDRLKAEAERLRVKLSGVEDALMRECEQTESLRAALENSEWLRNTAITTADELRVQLEAAEAKLAEVEKAFRVQASRIEDLEKERDEAIQERNDFDAAYAERLASIEQARELAERLVARYPLNTGSPRCRSSRVPNSVISPASSRGMKGRRHEQTPSHCGLDSSRPCGPSQDMRAGFRLRGRAAHFELDGGEYFSIFPGFEWRYQTVPSKKERAHVFGSVGEAT